jgi:hypothetical protein
MARRLGQWAVIAMALLGGWGHGLATRADAPVAPEIQSVELGFAGKCKVGHWVPVWVTLRGATTDGRGRLELSTPDGDGVPVIYSARTGRDDGADRDGGLVSVRAGQEKSLLGYVRLGRERVEVTARFLVEGGGVSSRTVGPGELPALLPATTDLIVTLGPPIGADEAVKKRQRDRGERLAHVHVEESKRLPSDWFGYESVGTLIAATSRPSALEQLDDRQFAALDRWLQLGGRLVLCAGARGAELFGAESRLARFAPGSNAKAMLLHATGGLENYAGATERLDSVGGQRARRFSVAATSLSGIRGLTACSELDAAEGRLPTIVRCPYGLGQVVFVAVDLDRAPFDQWSGRPSLVAKLLSDDTPGRRAEAGESGRASQVVHVGYDDLTGQLRGALDQFVGVSRVEFSWIAGLIVLYVLLIGPADYWLLRKFHRPHWTWVTFPVLVLLFCALAGVLSTSRSGHRLHVNQVDVVDIDQDLAVARGTTWVHLYSPTTAAFDLTCTPQLPPAGPSAGEPQLLLTWQGLPGQGLGGLSSASTVALFSEPYTTSVPQDDAGAGRIRGLPVQVSGSKSLVARWSCAGPATLRSAPRLAADRHGMVRGEVRNPLHVDLTDCLILYENWVYPLPGALAAGQTCSLDGLSPRNLEWRLTRRRVVDTKDVGTPWDKASLDVPRILEIMMFHKAAGAELYTGLTHAYQSYLDLSDHLRAGRAVLLGRGTAPAALLARDGRPLSEYCDQHWAYYRVVLPVDRPQGN